MTTRTLKISELKLDYALYPREKPDQFNIYSLMESMRTGGEIPPILVDRQTMKVVDGFHRVIASTRLGKIEIESDVQDFKSDTEMFLAAIEKNACHGSKISAVDQIVCVQKSIVFGIDPKILSANLNLSVEKINQQLKVDGNAVAREIIRPMVLNKQMTRPLRKRIAEPNGDDPTPGLQARHAVYFAGQLILLFQSNLIDWSNVQLRGKLKTLATMIQDHRE